MRRILILSSFLMTIMSLKAQTDSLRIEKDGDRVLVIHKVASQQTLYSLARRYGTSVDAINKENPSLSSGLQVGQILRIPYGKALSLNSNNVTHTVASGETLFAIASKYGVQLNDIKELNGLTSNSLSVGQVLVVKKGAPRKSTEKVAVTSSTENDDRKEIPVIVDSVVTVEVITPEVVSKLEVPDPADELSSTPFKEIKEEGIAELIEDGEPTTKFLALHRTAPTGTVIKIRNRMNDLTVYVRVIGKLPETGDNENLIIKINKRTYDQLKALDQRFLVELSYFL